jgi:hypothetical protein
LDPKTKINIPYGGKRIKKKGNSQRLDGWSGVLLVLVLSFGLHVSLKIS